MAAAAEKGRAKKRRQPNRPAAARREQYARAQARVAQTLVKSFLALNHRGCRRSKIGDVLLRLLTEDSNGDEEDSSLSATAGMPWQWQWPQADETSATASQPWEWHWPLAAVHWPQPTWPRQPVQPESPLEPAQPASAGSTPSALETAQAAKGEAEARAKSAAPASPGVPRTDSQQPASLELEQSLAKSDRSSSTKAVSATEGEAEARASAAPASPGGPRTDSQQPASLVPEHASTKTDPGKQVGPLDSFHSQGLDNTEEATVEAALASPTGQEDLSASSKTVLPQAAQMPLARTLASGLVGSFQASLVAEAPEQHPLDGALSAALAAAEDIDLQLEKAKKALVHLVERSLEPTFRPKPGLYECLEREVETLTALSLRKRQEHLLLLQVRAETPGGSAAQHNRQDD